MHLSRALAVLALLATAGLVHARDLHVTPEGAADGDGSAQRPLSLEAAFAGKGVEPGDTVWIAGGGYAGIFTTGKAGREDAPIVYRAQPGQRVTLAGGIRLHRADVWLWGMEITGKGPEDAIHVHGAKTDRVKIINNVIHDCPHPE